MDKLEPMQRDPVLWVGRGLSTLEVLFLLFDVFGKLTMPQPVMDAFLRLGLATRVSMLISALLLGGTLLYALPTTSVLGAVAIHVRAGSPMFETIFPVLFGTILWAGLLMRERRLLQVFPLRRG